MTIEWALQAPTEMPEEADVPAVPLLQPSTRPAQPKDQRGAIPKGDHLAELRTEDIVLPRTGYSLQCATVDALGMERPVVF